MKLLNLITKYSKYIDLFTEIGRALELAKNGENFDVSSDLSLNGKKKIVQVAMRDR